MFLIIDGGYHFPYNIICAVDNEDRAIKLCTELNRQEGHDYDNLRATDVNYSLDELSVYHYLEVNKGGVV